MWVIFALLYDFFYATVKMYLDPRHLRSSPSSFLATEILLIDRYTDVISFLCSNSAQNHLKITPVKNLFRRGYAELTYL